MQAEASRSLSAITGRGATLVACTIVSVGGCAEANSDASTLPRQAEAFHLQSNLKLYGIPGTPFGVIGAIASDVFDRFYVLDGLSQTVYVFDANGGYVDNFGGPGSGPGEFRGAMDVTVSPDSLVWVTDAVAGRHIVFDLDGNVVRIIPRRYRGDSHPGDRSFTADGDYVDWILRFPNETAFASSDVIEMYPMILGAVEDGDTMPPIKFWPDLVDIGNERRPAVFFAPTPVIAMDGLGSIWFSESREYRVLRRSLAGDTIGELSLREEPALVSNEDRREIQELARGRLSMQQYIDVLPERKPIIVGIVPDGAGHVLVIPESATARRGEVVDVFRETGEYFGRMSVPDPVDAPVGGVVMHATKKFLYVGGTNEVGAPVLLRFRIVASE